MKNLHYCKRRQWLNIWRPEVHVKEKIFLSKTLKKIRSPLNNASFDTFCDHIAHWSTIRASLSLWSNIWRFWSKIVNLRQLSDLDTKETKRINFKIQMLSRFCSKIFCLTWTACRQISVHYIRMEQGSIYIPDDTVNWKQF